MLDVAIERKLYDEVGCIFHGCNQFPKDKLGTFDVATCAGGFRPAHLPASAIPEFYEAVEVGGYMTTAIVEAYFHSEGYLAEI